MVQDNMVICYEGIQRVYRNSIVRFLRTKLQRAFPDTYIENLRKPFQKEWETIQQNALKSRQSRELTSPVSDEFDLLSVNHFFNLFDIYFDILVDQEPNINKDEKNKHKQTLLNWIKTVKNLRDPLSHPAEEQFSREDTFQLLDSARRVLLRLNLINDAHSIKLLIDKVLGSNFLSMPQEPLEDQLPHREAIGGDFIGRSKEIADLWEWLRDPFSRIWALAGEGGKGKSALAYNIALEVKYKAPQPFQIVMWLSAKRRKFIEGSIIANSPDFTDLDSFLSRLLLYYGWVDEIDNSIDIKRKRVVELLGTFPAFIVVDDVDSLEGEGENVIQFLIFDVPQTKSKTLFTSRRKILGMGGTTTHVSGFTDQDAEAFIYARSRQMGLDENIFDKTTIQKIIGVTEGSPLFIEDLMRLSWSVNSVQEAIQQWSEQGGDEARRYALSRECELLSLSARSVLLAACISSTTASFTQLEAMTGLSTDTVRASLQDLQNLFLVPKPKLIDGEQRFEVNANTKALVKEVYGNYDLYRRIETNYRIILGEMPKNHRGEIGAIIRQAIFLNYTGKHTEAEDLLTTAIDKYGNNANLLGVLGRVYRSWQPPRITDARKKFNRAWQLKCSKPEMYDYWCEMEINEREWTKAAEAAEKGLQILNDNKKLLFLAGYSRQRLAKELMHGLQTHRGKEELLKARKFLERATKIRDPLNVREDTLNDQTYRALVLACELLNDLKAVQRYFDQWKQQCPSSSDVITEWDRVSKKYSLQGSVNQTK